MTPAELADTGRQLFGENWQTAMARWLPCAPRNVRRWYAQQRKIPADIASRLRLELERKSRAPALYELEKIGLTGQLIVLPAPQTEEQREAVVVLSNYLAAVGFKVAVRGDV